MITKHEILRGTIKELEEYYSTIVAPHPGTSSLDIKSTGNYEIFDTPIKHQLDSLPHAMGLIFYLKLNNNNLKIEREYVFITDKISNAHVV